MKNHSEKLHILCRFFAFFMIVVILCLAISGCKNNNGDNVSGDNGSDDTDIVGSEADFSVTVSASDGYLLHNITLEIYNDKEQNDLYNVVKTDKNGIATFTGIIGNNYYVVLQNIPNCYKAEKLYTITEKVSKIVLNIEFSTEISESAYNLGDIVFDFTVKDTDNNEYTMSKLLEKNNVVVLNFWYTSCEPCKAEFPYISEAYQIYKDKLCFIAVSPIDWNEAVAKYKDEQNLDFPMASVDKKWEEAFNILGYPTTIVINKNGRIVFRHSESFKNVNQVKEMFEYFSGDKYDNSVVDNAESVFTGNENPDNHDNPKEVFGVSSLELTVNPNETVYCDLYRVTGKYLSINAENTVITIGNERYTTENGVLGVLLTDESNFMPIKLGVTNESDVTKTYKFTIDFIKGTADNPHVLGLGRLTVPVAAGNDQGVYYTYTATANGSLSLEFLSGTGGYSANFILYNLTSYMFRNNDENGETNDKGNTVVSVPVNKGDVVRVSVSVVATGNEYPAATFAFNAIFTPGNGGSGGGTVTVKEYKVTVTDENGKPLEGIFVKFNSDDPVTIQTDENGVAATYLHDGNYTIHISTLPGYTVDFQDFVLSESSREKTVVVSQIEVITAEYTVSVVDDNNKPIPDISVSVGGKLAATDSEGKAVFVLEDKDGYVAAVSMPEGFITKSDTSFGYSKSIVIKLTEDQSVVPDKLLDYSVKVVFSDGKPCTVGSVLFESNGSQQAMIALNDFGIAKTKLKEGNYNASIAFASGDDYFYDKTSTKLNSANRDITVVVAPKISEDFITLYVGNAYKLSEGAYYAQTANNDVTYFAFTPTVSGLYRFELSSIIPKISYWGGNVDYIYNMTDNVDVTDNGFEINVKDVNLGSTFIIGVEGTDGCVIITKRLGDFIPDENDIPPVIYQPTVAPKPFSLNIPNGQALIGFDITSATDAYSLVYNSADGYYHLGTANGAIVYVNLGENAPYISLKEVVSAANMGKSFYDENGRFIKREVYTDCVQAYASCIDETHGVYPLTDDLIYIIKSHGEYVGWWNSNSPSYILHGINNLNTNIGWMFALCYVG